MEPARVTDPRLRGVLEELVRQEPLFHRCGPGATRADFEALMAPQFWETGASGQRYSREHVLDVLQQRSAAAAPDEWKTSDFYCQQLAPDLYLLTYTLLQGPRLTRRTTLWRRAAQGWQAVYHQGTVAQV